MDPVLKQAIKDLLHSLVDKEEPTVIIDLLGKLPPAWAAAAQGLATAILPAAIVAEDKVIDGL